MCDKLKGQTRGGQEGIYFSSHLYLFPKTPTLVWGMLKQKTKTKPFCSRWKLHVLSSNLSSPAEVTVVASINLVVSETEFPKFPTPSNALSDCSFADVLACCQRYLKCPEVSVTTSRRGWGRMPPAARCVLTWRQG